MSFFMCKSVLSPVFVFSIYQNVLSPLFVYPLLFCFYLISPLLYACFSPSPNPIPFPMVLQLFPQIKIHREDLLVITTQKVKFQGENRGNKMK